MARARTALALPLAALAFLPWAGGCFPVRRSTAPSGPETEDMPFADAFDVALAVEEAGSPSESASAGWWVSSGGRFVNAGGLGMTLQGILPERDRWRLAYAASNPVDTENGCRPQNIFRLVTRRRWKDFEQMVFFRIRRVNLTDSPNRAGHNGVFLLHRYADGDNLYYAGIRVDGTAMVKRKKGGVYATLASARVYSGTYDRLRNPNLIPMDCWIGLKTSVAGRPGGGVSIRLEVNDPAAARGWTRVIEVVDPPGSEILTAGHAGIRTDFLDVELEGYQAGPPRT